MIDWWIAVVTFVFGASCGVVFMAGQFALHAHREILAQDLADGGES